MTIKSRLVSLILMLRHTLFANRIFNNIAKKHKESKVTIDGCTGVSLIGDSFPDQDRHLKKGEYVCVETESSFLAIGKGLTIEGKDYDTGKDIPKVENAFGGTYGIFKITATEETDVSLYYIDAFYSETIEEEDGTTTSKYYLFLKQETSVELSGSIRLNMEEGKVYRDLIFGIFKNTLGMKASITRKEGLYDYTYFDANDEQKSKELTSDNLLDITSKFLLVSPNYDLENIDPTTFTGTTSTIQVDVKADKIMENWPNKNIELTRATIFGPDTPEISFSKGGDNPPSDGLGTGEIIGIVIACIVVVGAIVFCVVWFVVLKKGCCNNKSSTPSA